MEIKTTEFFKNIKKLPPEDSEEFQQLIDWEIEKCIGGVTVNGVFISGWLYFHINHWWIRIDTQDEYKNEVRIESLPELRDNEWIRAEYLERCKQEKKGYMEVGGRQSGKSEMEASYFGMNAVLFKNTQNVIVCGNDNDLSLLKDKVDFGLKKLWQGISIPRLDKTWRLNQIRLGYKKPDGEDEIWSYIIIRNAKDGNNTEVAAGTTAKTFIMDEVGKYPFASAFKAAEPAFKGKFGLRAVPILVGCVCAGTKVWNNKGDLINIEDINLENGILGYDGEKISKEVISYLKKPHKKQCFRIETNKGTYLECSHDHPILYRSRNETEYVGSKKGVSRVKRKMYFKCTEELNIGDQIALIEEVPIFGDKIMWEPRLIGWLIGDGSYGFDKTPILANCDDYINNYIEKNFVTKLEREHITKQGKHYKETRIKGICKNLKDIGIYAQTKDKKTLPINIHSYRKEDICELIGGLFDTDGSVNNGIKSPPCIFLSSAYKNLLFEIKLLLQKLGIHSNIKFDKPHISNQKSKNGCYRLNIIDRKSIQYFYENITFKLDYKQYNLEKIIEILNTRKNKIPKEVKGLRFERIVKIEKIGEKLVYNLTAKNTNTYIANGIITHNTGGSFEHGVDAENFFYNPASNNFLGIPNPKTKGETGVFLSGLYRQDCKEEITLDKWLIEKRGLNLTNTSELSKIIINVTNEEKALSLIQKERTDARTNPDRKLLLKHIMYYPLTEDECFLRDNYNLFPVELAKAQKARLLLEGRIGTPVILKHNGEKIVHEFTDKQPISNFPLKPNDDKDAPIVIYEFPISDTPPYGLYVAGTDNYRFAQATYSESVGTVYIYKRMHDILSEQYQDILVASYAARPDRKETWEEQARFLIKYYNARTLCENDDISFIQHMIDKGDSRYLERQPEWLKELVPNTTVHRDFGIHRSAEKIRTYLHSLLKDYMEEVIYTEKDENGNTIKEVLGVVRIPDPLLLEEIIQFNEDGNFDRIVAFELALAQRARLDPIMGRVSESQGRTIGHSNRNNILFTRSRGMFSKRKKKLFI